MSLLSDLRVPVIAAPMGGGPSTPELVVAVGEAGGLGFLAGAYQDAASLAGQIRAVRERTDAPFGVNVFVPGQSTVDYDALDRYALRLQPVAARLGVPLGQLHWDDDAYAAKLALLTAEAVPLVSFTFGCPAAETISRLRRAGSTVAVSVTSVAEAAQALAAGADALVVQGAEAGAHRASFIDDAGADALPLLDLLANVRGTGLALIATGGLMTGADIRVVLDAGACVAALGTAFLCSTEAATNPTYRRALTDPGFTATAFTRAFTGRTARGLVNDFLRTHSGHAPAGYPWVHQLTRPLRVAAAEQGDAQTLHLWAGTGWRRIRPMPAGDLVALLADEVNDAPAGCR